MAITTLDHYTINTLDLDATIRFYVEVMGFENGERPAFSFPGAWLYCEGQPIVHSDRRQGARGSRDRDHRSHRLPRWRTLPASSAASRMGTFPIPSATCPGAASTRSS